MTLNINNNDDVAVHWLQTYLHKNYCSPIVTTRCTFLLHVIVYNLTIIIFLTDHTYFSLMVMLVILVNCVFIATNREVPNSE